MKELKVKDITVKYIKDNFDIDKERQEITETLTGSLEFHGGPISVEDFINDIKEQYNQFVDDFSVSPDVKIRKEWTPDFHSHEYYEFIGQRTRKETDKEVISRLQKEQKQKISNAQLKNKTKQQRFRQYQKLKKEFENE